MKRIEFFYDLSSPWTYLAFVGIQPLAARHGACIDWKPILVGGVFNAVNKEVYENRANPNPRRFAYMQKDLQDWARACGIRIGWPSVFPVNAVKAMRGALVAQAEGLVVPYSAAVFDRYWGALQDISQETVLAEVAQGLGLDPGRFLTRITEAPVKEQLRANTEELVARGGFGSPTMFLDATDMYFGNDRLPLLERALAG